jgi:hypothetical protein
MVVHELMWVYLADPPLIDNAIYAMWVDGISDRDVQIALRAAYENVDSELILKLVQDQYKLFVEMNHYLASPWLFNEHRFMLHIDGQLRGEMLEKYYTFDASVVREFLGKRLNEKVRLGLGEIALKAGVLSRSATRQFENIRRIYKRATHPHTTPLSTSEASLTLSEENSSSLVTSGPKDDPEDENNLLSHIASPPIASKSQDLVTELVAEFQLSRPLARKYARIVYAAVHQFELDKKRLAHLKYKEVDTMIGHMIRFWGSVDDGPSFPAPPINTRQSIELHRASELDSRDGLTKPSGIPKPASPSNPSVLATSSPEVILTTTPAEVSVADVARDTLDLNDFRISPPATASNVVASGSASYDSSSNSSSELYPMLNPHPKLVSRLNHIKGLASSHKTETATFVDEIRRKLGDYTDLALASSAPDPSRQSRSTALVSYKFIKSFLHIGTTLGQSKEYKKIFMEILDHIVQPCIDAKLTSNEVEELFRLIQVEGQSFIISMLGTAAKSSSKRHLSDAWHTYLEGLIRICLVLGADGGRK